jgi:hypothetical protein
MAKDSQELDQLFHDTLKNIYFAEKKILNTLPKMEKAAHSEDPDVSPLHRLSNTTKCRGTARFAPGPKSWDSRRPSHCLKRRSRSDEALTQIAESVVNQDAQAAANKSGGKTKPTWSPSQNGLRTE